MLREAATRCNCCLQWVAKVELPSNLAVVVGAIGMLCCIVCPNLYTLSCSFHPGLKGEKRRRQTNANQWKQFMRKGQTLAPVNSRTKRTRWELRNAWLQRKCQVDSTSRGRVYSLITLVLSSSFSQFLSSCSYGHNVMGINYGRVRLRAPAMLLFCSTHHVRQYIVNSYERCSMCGLTHGKTTSWTPLRPASSPCSTWSVSRHVKLPRMKAIVIAPHKKSLLIRAMAKATPSVVCATHVWVCWVDVGFHWLKSWKERYYGDAKTLMCYICVVLICVSYEFTSLAS